MMKSRTRSKPRREFLLQPVERSCSSSFFFDPCFIIYNQIRYIRFILCLYVASNEYEFSQKFTMSLLITIRFHSFCLLTIWTCEIRDKFFPIIYLWHLEKKNNQMIGSLFKKWLFVQWAVSIEDDEHEIKRTTFTSFCRILVTQAI